MIRLFVALLTVVALTGCSREQRSDTVASEQTNHLPGLSHIQSQISSQLLALRGQWVVINYWAQWCGPCIKEIPELNELHQRYSKVTVLGVNYDGASGKALTRQSSELGVAFPQLPGDPAALLNTHRPTVLPTTLILDPAGDLVATLAGPQTVASLAQATQQLVSGNEET